MTTITIQIGNTDDKLAQGQWSVFVLECQLEIDRLSYQIHFGGGPACNAAWQNYAWVILCEERNAIDLRNALTNVRMRYGQDSIAWTQGNTLFI